MKILNEEQDRD